VSVELKRFVADPEMDATVRSLATVVNRLIARDRGDQGGRIWLLGDDGNKKATYGSSGVPAGTVLSANNYPLRIEPTSTNQLNILNSNGVTVGLRVQDAGVTMTTGTVTGTGTIGTLVVTGTALVGSTATFNGAVTLGDAAGDAIAVVGTATFTPLATFTGGLTSTGALTANGAVTLGDNASDVITVTGTATFAALATFTTGIATGATPAAAGAIRLSNATAINARNAANSADLNVVTVDGSDNLLFGQTGSSAGTFFYGTTQAGVLVGANFGLQVLTTGTRLGWSGGDIGFYGSAGGSKPTVSGSRGGNAALADLLNELAGLGLITDSSS
jgi:hypothetical protein